MAMPSTPGAETARRLRFWCAAFVLTVATVVLCVQYLDRPISRLAEAIFGRISMAAALVGTPGLFDPLAVLVLGLFLLRRLSGRRFGKPDLTLLLGAASLLFADTLKDGLKYIFGRTWPKYGFPSFIHDGAYGFHPFHEGYIYQSFPSGHAAAVCALLSVFWILYPRFRTFYAVVALGAAGGLVAMNYHFLGDVVAGGFLGASTGVLVVSAWEFLDRRLVAR